MYHYWYLNAGFELEIKVTSQKLTPFNYALKLLQLRDRSQGEIEEKMKQKSYLEEEISATISKLGELEFINDRKFAASYVRNQLMLKPQGKRALWIKLKRLRLSDEIISEVLDKLDNKAESIQAHAAAERWLNQHRNLPDEERKVKLSRYLAGRGFGWETVKRVLESIF